MDVKQQQAMLAQVQALRTRADAMVVLGITADNFFYAIDDRLSVPDLRKLLNESVPHICDGVERARAKKGAR